MVSRAQAVSFDQAILPRSFLICIESTLLIMAVNQYTTTGFLIPPSVVPNYENSEQKGQSIQTLAILCSIISTFFVLLRLYTRVYLSRAFGKDDGKPTRPDLTEVV